jgi:hypothetical protein
MFVILFSFNNPILYARVKHQMPFQFTANKNPLNTHFINNIILHIYFKVWLLVIITEHIWLGTGTWHRPFIFEIKLTKLLLYIHLLFIWHPIICSFLVKNTYAAISLTVTLMQTVLLHKLAHMLTMYCVSWRCLNDYVYFLY